VFVRSHTVLKNRVKRHSDMAFLGTPRTLLTLRGDIATTRCGYWRIRTPGKPATAAYRSTLGIPALVDGNHSASPQALAACGQNAFRQRRGLPAGRRVRFRGLCCRRRALALPAETRQLNPRDGSAGKSARRRRAATAVSRLRQLPIALPWRQGLDSRGSPRWLTVTVAPGRDFNWTRCSSPRNS
jgi:hypothetical protein